MDDRRNVFISWSGQRSKVVAETLRDWLPLVLQAVKPWMSDADIDKGSRGLDEVGRALEGMKIGIICLTPENLDAPWILYEAGALSKTLDAKTRLCTYLLSGLRLQDVKPPLGMFQATKSDKEDTRKLLHTINKALDGEPVPDANLNTVFDGMWLRLEQKLAAIPAPEHKVESKRSADEMLAEILELSRAEANRRSKIEDLSDALQEARNAQMHNPSLTSRYTTLRDLLALKDVSAVRTEPRKKFSVKLEYDDDVKTIEGTTAVEDAPGRLIIYDNGRPIARFVERIQNWWAEPIPDAGTGTDRRKHPRPLTPPP